MGHRTDLLSELLRDLEVGVGTSDMALIVFDSLRHAVHALDVEDNEEFYQQLTSLVKSIHKVEPKYAILNYYASELLTDFEEAHNNGAVDFRHWAEKRVARIHEEMQEKTDKILEYSDKINFQGKTILLHDHSHTVHRVLQYQKKQKKKFRVIVAEQEHDKTQENIEVLHAAKIPFQVVPDYMLSHIHANVDMVFYGGLTLKDSMHFVMDPGSCAVISQFNTMKIPVYIFMKTTKFSLWKSKPRGEIYFKKNRRKHASKPIAYDRLKYSHDRVSVDLLHKIVTNKGIFTPPEVKKAFDTLVKKIKR